MNSLLAMFWFEVRRLMTPGRAFWWVIVAAFPVTIVMLMQEYGPIADVDEWRRQLTAAYGRSVDAKEAQQHIDTVLTIAIYYLAPSISCMLGCLLTAAPAIASEVEQHSWVYLATRPNGLFHLVMGKYPAAAPWTTSSTLTGLALTLPVVRIHGKLEAATALIGVTMLSAMAYSALFLMVGTLFHRRAMVFCVAYTAAVEMFLGFFPAVINRFTIQYRLRSLLFEWTTQSPEFRDSGILEFVAATEGAMLQVLWLLSLTVVFVAVSLVTVQVREFTVAAETDV